MPARLLLPLAPLVLAGCASDLSAPARPMRSLASYFSSDDYPATLHGESGTTVFRLTVGPNGRVSRCVITASSGSAALDSATCRLLVSRARFEPARDRNGLPTSDIAVGRVEWRLPEEDGPAAAGPKA
jgi:protein TonB